MKRGIIGTALFVCFFQLVETGYAQEHEKTNLAPGIVLSEERVIFANQAGGVSALDVRTGESIWSIDDGRQVPLEVVNDKVVGILRSGQTTQVVRLTISDSNTGRMINSPAMQLPEGSIFPEMAFLTDGVTTTRFRENQIQLLWMPPKAEPLQGLPPGTLNDDSDDINAAVPVFPEIDRPQFMGIELDLNTGEVADIKQEFRPPVVPNRTPNEVGEDDLVPNAKGRQTLSRNGGHVMVSEKADDIWLRYRLRFFDRQTKNELGSFPYHSSSINFIVQDQICVFESQPYSHRKEGKLVVYPRRVIAVDLESAQQIWAESAADFSYRGPLPP